MGRNYLFRMRSVRNHGLHVIWRNVNMSAARKAVIAQCWHSICPSGDVLWQPCAIQAGDWTRLLSPSLDVTRKVITTTAPRLFYPCHDTGFCGRSPTVLNVIWFQYAKQETNKRATRKSQLFVCISYPDYFFESLVQQTDRCYQAWTV